MTLCTFIILYISAQAVSGQQPRVQMFITIICRTSVNLLWLKLFKITSKLPCPYHVISTERRVIFICFTAPVCTNCKNQLASICSQTHKRGVSHSIHHGPCHHHCQKFNHTPCRWISNLVLPQRKITSRRLGHVHIIASRQVNSPPQWVLRGGCIFFAIIAWKVRNLPLNFIHCSTIDQFLQNLLDRQLIRNLTAFSWTWYDIGCEVVS